MKAKHNFEAGNLFSEVQAHTHPGAHRKGDLAIIKIAFGGFVSAPSILTLEKVIVRRG